MQAYTRRTTATLLVLTVFTAVPAVAQFTLIEKALEKVESVGIYYIYGILGSSSDALTTGTPGEEQRRAGLTGFAVELGLGVGGIQGSERKCKRDDERPSKVDTVQNRVDTRRVKGKTIKTTHVQTQTTPGPCHNPDVAAFQVAMGYSQVGGFEAQDPSFDLKGSIRELPAFAFYVTFFPEDRINLYLGIRGGILQLHSLRAYDTTSTTTGEVYAGSGSTFQAGVALGVLTSLDVINLFVEPSYHVRRIQSVEWTPVSNKVPVRLPRDLNFSGFQFAFGIEVPIR